MAPKVKPIDDALADISAQLAALVSIPASIKNLEALVRELKSENAELRSDLDLRDKELLSLKGYVNSIDQASRAFNLLQSTYFQRCYFSS